MVETRYMEKVLGLFPRDLPEHARNTRVCLRSGLAEMGGLCCGDPLGIVSLSLFISLLCKK